jgi:hypothetical protein
MLINASLAVGFTAIGYILFRFTAAPNFNFGVSYEGADEDKDKSNGDKYYGIRNLSGPDTVIPLNDLSADSNKPLTSTLPTYDEILEPLNFNDEDTDIGTSDGRESLYTIYMNKEEPKEQSKKSLGSPTKKSLGSPKKMMDSPSMSPSKSGTSRRPRDASKKKNQAKDLTPTQVYVQPIPGNINHRKSYHNSLAFSDLNDYVEGATKRDSPKP